MAQRKSFLGTVAVAAALALGAAGLVAIGSISGTSSAYAATTAGCGKAPTLRSGTQSIQSSGLNRSYILSIPGNYDRNRAYRLVFANHWNGANAGIVANNGNNSFYGLQRLANNSAIFVAPDGLNAGWANSGGRDVTLMDDIRNRIESDLCVDTTQRFALGFSFGGAMSYALACARPDVFRAVAVISGAALSGCSGGSRPVAYFGIHGIRDDVLAIAQGRTLRDTFVRNNGCAAQSPREPGRGSLTHIITAYSGCRAGYPVQWAAFDEGHLWSPVDGSTGYNDSRTWVSGEIWTFFTQLQPGGTTTPPPSTSIPTGWARVANAATGLAMDSGGNVASGSQLKQWSYDGSTNLQWQFVALGGGWYRLVNRTNGMVADSWGDATNGAAAKQAAWNGGSNQQWRLNDMGGGRYQIINRGTGTALDSGGSTTAGSPVKLWAPDASANLQWSITGV
jgi:poly(3-hydroxybutyrate) depolymerase